ncbi:DNA repair protein REV1 like protein [Argiope bruennichi]|uniref:DNA repair protein REV1 n=1 Tax=Argiope bruennichi TaxID=94029 RepID=A0A8T0E151_ARGBR|nr:DNA repair protein REV1 like protein [Argiope bruennichi]
MLLSDMMGPGWSFWVGTVLLLAAGSVFGFDCEFPNRECGWNWSEAWTLLSAANISALGPTAPQADSENNVKGEMLYYSAEVSGPQSLLKVVSPVFEPHTLPTCALQFALHMFRMDFAKFKMIINAPNNSWESTTFEGNSAHRWENQTQPINVVTQPFQVILEILNPGTTYPSHVAIDDIRAINCYHSVGYVTAEKFRSSNIRTCEDMQKIPLSKLQQEFGPKTGQTFYNNCRGKDDRIVKYFKDRKSVSAEINYGIRFETEEDIYNFINELSIEVQNRIQKLNSKGKLVTLKLMVRKSDAPVETAKYMGHGICDHISQSTPLKSATDSSQVISKICCGIARSLKIKPQNYRGVGIQLKSDMIGIDQSFLNALPEDLKKKILNNFISNKKHEYSAAASSQQPSTSFAPIPNNSTKLDESVLNALPEDLRKEVLESYGLYPSCETHKPQSSASKQTESCSGHLSSKIHEPQPSTTKQIYSSTEQKSSKEESEVNSDEFSQEKIPTLGGVIELDDLRALIKEWMDSTDDPFGGKCLKGI